MRPSTLANSISEDFYKRAAKVIPRGVTRPFRFLDPYPFYVKKARGTQLVDFEERVYSDFWMGHGALVLGHMHPSVTRAAREQLELGFHFGTCNEWEVKLAEQVTRLVPSVQMITFNNSGTEANMHALKLARAYTKRDKVGKFEGHFHGILETLFVGVTFPLGEPESAGHDPLSAKNTVILPFGDLDAASKIIKKEELACVITELVVGGACFPIDRDFLKGLREVCDDTGTLLIFDEVITGFRLAPGGAQEVFGVIPDLTTFGKAIGGGEFPVGAVGGRAEIMDLMNHAKHTRRSERVVQGGTYVGNPLVMRAGYEATKEYERGNVYAQINNLGQKLVKGLQDAVEDTDSNAHVTGHGSIAKLHFLKDANKTKDLRSLKTHTDAKMEREYFGHLVSAGILAMTPDEVHFYVSLPHTQEQVEKLVATTEQFLRAAP